MSAAQTGDTAIKIQKKWLRRKLEVPGSQTHGEQTHHVGSALPTAGLSRKAERVLLANLRNCESHPKCVESVALAYECGVKQQTHTHPAGQQPGADI